MATSSTSKKPRLALPMSINDLPLVEFVEIFSYISLDEAVTTCSNVCVQWRETIVLHILAPNIRVRTRSSPQFKNFLEKKGWNEESDDVEQILSFYDIYNFFSSK